MDPLAGVASEKQRVVRGWGDGSKQAQLGGSQILRFVNDDMIERLALPRRIMSSHIATDLGAGEGALAHSAAATGSKTDQSLSRWRGPSGVRRPSRGTLA